MKKLFCVLGVIAAAALIIYGLSIGVPEKHVTVSSSYSAYNYDWDRNTGAQYLGGDAYNYQVEASLKAGYYAGVVTVKSVTIVGGILLLFMSIFALSRISQGERQTEILMAIERSFSAKTKESDNSTNESPSEGQIDT